MKGFSRNLKKSIIFLKWCDTINMDEIFLWTRQFCRLSLIWNLFSYSGSKNLHSEKKNFFYCSFFFFSTCRDSRVNIYSIPGMSDKICRIIALSSSGHFNLDIMVTPLPRNNNVRYFRKNKLKLENEHTSARIFTNWQTHSTDTNERLLLLR